MAKQEALPRAYEPAEVEKKWFPEWEKAGVFHGSAKSAKPVTLGGGITMENAGFFLSASGLK